MGPADASQGIGRQIVFLEEELYLYRLQVWLCDLELASIFQEKKKRKGKEFSSVL